jgi:hypothetical protein
MVTGIITASDYLAAQYLHRRQTVKALYTFSIALIAVGAVWLCITPNLIAFAITCGAVGGLVGELIVSTAILPRRALRIHHQRKEFSSPTTYSWDNEFLITSSRDGHAKKRWKDYLRLREDDGMLLLYHSDDLFQMVPKRWFSNADDLMKFTELARERA